MNSKESKNKRRLKRKFYFTLNQKENYSTLNQKGNHF